MANKIITDAGTGSQDAVVVNYTPATGPNANIPAIACGGATGSYLAIPNVKDRLWDSNSTTDERFFVFSCLVKFPTWPNSNATPFFTFDPAAWAGPYCRVGTSQQLQLSDHAEALVSSATDLAVTQDAWHAFTLQVHQPAGTSTTHYWSAWLDAQALFAETADAQIWPYDDVDLVVGGFAAGSGITTDEVHLARVRLFDRAVTPDERMSLMAEISTGAALW